MEPVDDPEPMTETTPAITEMSPADVMQDAPDASDTMTGELTWVVSNNSRNMAQQKIFSDAFFAGGYPWNILLFPRKGEWAALYLNAADASTAPFGWQRKASFRLMLLNQEDPAKSISREAEHVFYAREGDWGFTQYIPLSELNDPQRGFVVNNSFKVKAIVKVEKVDSSSYDSKESTGCVGLKNQGATCYMNSLLQTLFHLNAFRKAVYHMPTDDEAAQGSMALALQSLFYKLQFGETSVSTKELTKSFGWDPLDGFMQHDVQELNRVLAEKLEEKMKGTVVDGTINKLFEGRTQNYMACINVEYKSVRADPFMDLQLDVKGCHTIYDSFNKYCEIERLDGQNQYMAEGHGLQDAEKGVKFDSFPPVLQLQLKRFEYDYNRGITVKINDRYEFEELLDLDRNDRAYLSEKADPNVRNLYKLHSVLVHSGGVHGGHYYSFTCTDGKNWLKFDDDKVTTQDTRRAVNEQFGGEDENATPGLNMQPYKFTKHSNAYMLVYVRASDWDDIMCEVKGTEIAEHVRDRLEREKAEKERKQRDKQEAHLYITVNVATEADLREQIGTSIYFDLVDFDKVQLQSKVKKSLTLRDFKARAAAASGIPVEQQRWWTWHRRSNHTFRPSSILTVPGDDDSVGMLSTKPAYTQYNPQPVQVSLLLEKAATPLITNAALLFLKFYDPVKAQLSYVGHIYVQPASRLQQVLPLLVKRAGLEENASILVWEEVKSEPAVMCEEVSPSASFVQAQIETGDILVLQRSFTQAEAEHNHLMTVRAFFEYQRNKLLVNFRKLDTPREEGAVTLELSRVSPYSEICTALAKQLGLEDPDKLRLTTHTAFNATPMAHPLRHGSDNVLAGPALAPQGGIEVLFYEVLSLPLPQLERMREIKVYWRNDRAEYVGEHELMVPRNGHIIDAASAVAEAVNQPGLEAASIRFLEITNNRITRVFNPNDGVDQLEGYWPAHAEAIPLDEAEVHMPEAYLLPVCHFARTGPHGVASEWGDPFLVKVHKSETFGELKQRLWERLKAEPEAAAKWELAILPRPGTPQYPADEDIIFEVLSRRVRANRQDLLDSPLAVEHPDTRKHKGRNAFRSLASPYEKPITIRS